MEISNIINIFYYIFNLINILYCHKNKKLSTIIEATEKLKLLSKYQNFRKISEVKYV